MHNPPDDIVVVGVVVSGASEATLRGPTGSLQRVYAPDMSRILSANPAFMRALAGCGFDPDVVLQQPSSLNLRGKIVGLLRLRPGRHYVGVLTQWDDHESLMWQCIQRCQDAFSVRIVDAVFSLEAHVADWELSLVEPRSSQARATRGFLAPMRAARSLELLQQEFQHSTSGQRLSGDDLFLKYLFNYF